MRTFRSPQHRPKKNTLIVGREAVSNALEEGKALDRIYLQSNVHGPWVDQLRLMAKERMVPILKVPIEKINRLNVFNHEGCVAQIARIQYQDLQQVISFVVEQGKTPLMVMLDGITDIRNIGAIARSAVCFGADAIIIPERGVGALTEDAVLTSAGALDQIAVCRMGNLSEAIECLHLNGIQVFASEMTATQSIGQLPVHEPCCFILGSEEKGVQSLLMKQADAAFHIPMPGNFESLNVSVAAGIMLFQTATFRMKVGN
jgi:23S rRNA (guanosine2251-2'-O)-methyltransferase